MLNKEELEVVAKAIEIINAQTANGDDRLILRGFGTFKRTMKAARTARNPKTGEPVAVPAKSVLTFKSSK